MMFYEMMVLDVDMVMSDNKIYSLVGTSAVHGYFGDFSGN